MVNMAACVRKVRLGHFRSCLQPALTCFRPVLRPSSELAHEKEGCNTETQQIPSSSEESESPSSSMYLEPWVAETISKNELKHKHHPGLLTLSTVALPDKLVQAVDVLLEKYPVKELSRKADKLANYLWSRHPPSSDAQLNRMLDKTYTELSEERERKGNQEPVTREDVLQKLRQKVYHWQPVTFDAYKSLLYLTAHLALNYSVLLQCFTELQKREPSFTPRSIFNLGSGLGSAIWAANRVWGPAVFEYYCVDKSQDMNTVARLLLQDGDNQKQMSIPGVVFRQFPPSPHTNQFDMVVSAYTLLDQPGQKERLEMVENLWHMTADVLVLVENGTTAGFTLINEARDHLLAMAQSKTDPSLEGHVFAPCPHDRPCPKFTGKNQPCFSQVSYKSLSQNHTKPAKCSMRYSYIVLRKGRRKDDVSWARVIQGVIKARRHTHCHLCCPDGQVRHTVITASKHGKDLYKCSRYTSWGDLLPVRFSRDDE